MKRVIFLAAVVGLGGLITPAWAACPADSVQSGTVCMDKYEGSVWYVPPTERNLINRIRNGTVSLDNLTSAGAVAAGVVQLLGNSEYCPPTGNGCVNVYAVSIPGVTPSRLTWFQAAAAARNSLKRLPTNQEWQVAALGTPDGADDDGSTTCNIGRLGLDVAPTGSRSACVSDVGAFDMVGNLWEWVADWGDRANGCTRWSSEFGVDLSCVGGPGAPYLPGPWLRGGQLGDDSEAGVFAVLAGYPSPSHTGFRCAR